MSFFRIGGEEELIETPAAVSVGGGYESDDDDDRFPDGGGDQDRHCPPPFVPQPLRRMNSDSIYDMSSAAAPAKKKGLSRYYEGRSQSFACLSEVRSLEDLQKKDKQKVNKSCKSYAALRGEGHGQQDQPALHEFLRQPHHHRGRRRV